MLKMTSTEMEHNAEKQESLSHPSSSAIPQDLQKFYPEITYNYSGNKTMEERPFKPEGDSHCKDINHIYIKSEPNLENDEDEPLEETVNDSQPIFKSEEANNLSESSITVGEEDKTAEERDSHHIYPIESTFVGVPEPKSSPQNDYYCCEVCPYRTNIKGNLSQHAIIHNLHKPFTCKLCPFTSKRNGSLKTHMINCHSENRTQNKIHTYSCEICPYGTNVKGSFKQHAVTHAPEKSFNCTLCSFKSKYNGNLKTHMLGHSRKGTPDKESIFSCESCPYQTNIKRNLAQHVINHNSDKPFTCTLCSYRAKRNEHIKSHMMTHFKQKNAKDDKTNGQVDVGKNANSEKRFACNFCSFKSNHIGYLKKHMLKHGRDEAIYDNGLYACESCPYRTNIEEDLTNHVLYTHELAETFFCTLCSFKSKFSANLHMHMLSHENNSVLFPQVASSSSATDIGSEK